MGQTEKQLIELVSHQGSRVTPGDISAATGEPIVDCRRQLNKLVENEKASLRVSKEGDLIYSLSDGGLASGLQQVVVRFLHFLRGIFEIIGIFLGAIFIGLATPLISMLFIVQLITGAFWAVYLLVLPFILFCQLPVDGSNPTPVWMLLGYMIFLVFLAICVVATGLVFNFTRSGIRWDRPIQAIGNWVAFSLSWFFEDLSAGVFTKYDPSYRVKSPLTSCLLLLLGHANPNKNLEARRWEGIASRLRECHGAVVLEQIAPFFDKEALSEDDMIPVMVRYNGVPHVSNTGNILYEFDDLQNTAVPEVQESSGAFLKERTWNWAGANSKLPWFLLFNGWASAWTLSWFVKTYGIVSAEASKFDIAFSNGILLAVTFCLALIALNFIKISILNYGIDHRNKIRLKRAQDLSEPNPVLVQKLVELESLQEMRNHPDNSHVIYSTDKNLYEQDL